MTDEFYKEEVVDRWTTENEEILLIILKYMCMYIYASITQRINRTKTETREAKERRSWPNLVRKVWYVPY
jgi:hypothetical protein